MKSAENINNIYIGGNNLNYVGTANAYSPEVVANLQTYNEPLGEFLPSHQLDAWSIARKNLPTMDSSIQAFWTVLDGWRVR